MWAVRKSFYRAKRSNFWITNAFVFSCHKADTAGEKKGQVEPGLVDIYRYRSSIWYLTIHIFTSSHIEAIQSFSHQGETVLKRVVPPLIENKEGGRRAINRKWWIILITPLLLLLLLFTVQHGIWESFQCEIMTLVALVDWWDVCMISKKCFIKRFVIFTYMLLKRPTHSYF